MVYQNIFNRTHCVSVNIMKKRALILTCFSIFYCLKASSGPTATAQLPILDNLVVFEPEIKIDSSYPCQGVRVSSDLIATAPECALKIRKLLDYKAVDVHTVQGELLGEASDGMLNDPQKRMLLSFTPNEQSVERKYPELYQTTSIPEQAFTYSIDPQGQLVRQSVVLSYSEELAEKSFTVSPEVSVPSGSPILDNNGRIVCILSDDSQCHILKRLSQDRVKRELADDDDDDGLSQNAQIGIIAGLGAAAIIIPTGIFYLVSYIKARSKGMSDSTFWAGILSLQYCSHCTSTTAMPAIISTILCPLTGMISCIVGYPISACMAASKWIDDSTSYYERTPIISQPPQPHTFP